MNIRSNFSSNTGLYIFLVFSFSMKDKREKSSI